MFNKIKTFRENAWYSKNPLVVVVAHPIGTVRMIIAAGKATAKVINKYPFLWMKGDMTERTGLIFYAMYRDNPEWIKLVKPEEQEWFENWAKEMDEARAELDAL